MQKKDLIQAVSDVTNIPPNKVKASLDAMIDIIITAVADGDSVIIPGFGRFYSKHCKARTCRNPVAGTKFLAPEKNVATFHPGKWMKDAVEKSSVDHAIKVQEIQLPAGQAGGTNVPQRG